MNLFSATILRYSFLLIVLAVSSLSFYSGISIRTSLSLASILAIPYFVSGWIIEKIKAKRFTDGEKTFTYVPWIIFSKRIIYSALFFVMSAFVIAPETRMVWLLPSILTLGTGEVIFFIIALRLKNYSLIFFKNQIIIKQEREEKIFAEEVERAEFRFNNFYLVLKNKKTFKFNPDFIIADQRNIFHDYFLTWAANNKINFTAEALYNLEKAAG